MEDHVAKAMTRLAENKKLVPQSPFVLCEPGRIYLRVWVYDGTAETPLDVFLMGWDATGAPLVGGDSGQLITLERWLRIQGESWATAVVGVDTMLVRGQAGDVDYDGYDRMLNS